MSVARGIVDPNDMDGLADEKAASLYARVVRQPPVAYFELSFGTSDEVMAQRIAQAASVLVSRDAAIMSALRLSDTQTLSWMFDPRPGNERAHDRVLDFVLPLLLPLIVTDDLYPFQRRGVAWLLRNKRGILADDMGLGKTVQVIAALRRLFRMGRVMSSIIVAPRTLLSNWVIEIDRWAPELITDRYRGGDTESNTLQLSRMFQTHIVLMSYEEARDPSLEMIRQPPDIVIADEAHRLRNSQSLAHQGLRRLPVDRFWALSGTPVENDPQDLASLLSLLEPAAFSVDDHRDGVVSLRSRARPYLLRRTKKTVQPELPRPVISQEVVALSDVQRAAYDQLVADYSPTEPGASLRLFNSLRRTCDLDESTGVSSKLTRAIEIVRGALSRNDKVVVFSYTIAPLRALLTRLRSELGDVAGLLIGDQSLQRRERVVAKFKDDPRFVVLLASMKVGGEGLTLIEANHVIMVNRWWNPSTNEQAIDRVVRLGQTKPVTVYYLTCEHTVEERLQPLLDRKKMTFSELIDALQHYPSSVAEILV